MNITSQKNRRMSQTVYQESFNSNYSPVKALTCRVHHIMKHGGHTELLIYMFYNKNALTPVNTKNMIDMIHKTIIRLKLHKQGIRPDLVGVYSLRA